MTGASATQIEHFVRSGVVRPAEEAPRRGMSRGFNLRNLIEIALAAELLSCGVAVREIPIIFQLTLRKHWKTRVDPGRRDEVAVLVLWFTSRVFTGTPRADVSTRRIPTITSIANFQMKVEQGDTIHAAINVKRIVEHVETATGEALS